jgi:hypothetical protein
MSTPRPFGHLPTVVESEGICSATDISRDAPDRERYERRAAVDAIALADQLQHALLSRVVIEQAKGVIGYHGDTDMEIAFAILGTRVRDHHLRLADVARAVVTREVDSRILIDHADASGIQR